MKQVTIYTDGACTGNPGPGGWGAILEYNGTFKELSGGEPATTNNRMELTAAIMALSALKSPCAVTLYSDSQYLVNAIEKGWLDNWQAKNWKRSGKDIPNVDLWKQLVALMRTHSVKYVWVKGHAGHEFNERCDKLATAMAKQYG